MRVIEPHQFSSRHRERRSSKKYAFTALIVMVMVIFAIYFTFFASKTHAPTANPDAASKAGTKGTLKTYTPQEFRDLYNSFAYPNTERISEKTPITGNEEADDHIRTMAAARGYTLRSAPVTDVFQEVAPGMQLQQKAVQPWLDMRAAAKKDNIALDISAAYRSAEEQTRLFTSRIFLDGINIKNIPTGVYDRQIAAVLQTTAVPGYSRHHTGYTVDITCTQNPSVSFIATNCFRWLSADNYKNAKTYGWIPSYPEGTGMQGPEPEAWEYVWVGEETLI